MKPIAFSGSPLDRADHIRQDAEALNGLMTMSARLLLLNGLDPVISDSGVLVWGSLADADPNAELVFLGLDGNRGCFAAVPIAVATGLPNARLWPAMAALSPEDLAIYGGARTLIDWHVRHRFCARCGGATVLVKGGWQRTCAEVCKAEHFPRVDPATIMLVEHNDSLLLGRQHRFPPGSYSALAGFVEPGETIEEAVAREVYEEAGVRVRGVTYIMSQPWPFPSSLMIGCHSIADDAALTIDATELEDARWFSRSEIAQAMHQAEQGIGGAGKELTFKAPPPFAVAHHLLKWWLERESPQLNQS